VSGHVVENQVYLAQVMNQERTSPPASCKVLNRHYTSCSPSCNENVVVETCDCLMGKKNDELKQEVKWLRERLASLMGKGKNDEEQVDIFQDKKEQSPTFSR
jgi:hypothetical protein